MALTSDQIATRMVTQLRLLDPSLSVEIGTPERKLIEATAEMIASQQVDFTVLNQQTDLATLSGGRLDAYLSIFNFGRQQATPSYGTVTFSRNLASSTQIIIPRGTQIQANLDNSIFPSLVFVTIDSAVLEVGSTSVDVLAQCTIAGTVGNIDANKVVGFAGLQSVAGISGVSNAQAFSKGADLETDTGYVTRFQNGFLRNISGTTDMFLALAVAANSVTKANVVGPISRYQEYIQIPAADDVAQQATYDSGGTTYPHKRTSAKSTIPYSQYTYTTNYYLTNSTLDPATATFYRSQVDFVFNTPPVDATSGVAQVNTTPTTSPNVTFLKTAAHGGNPLLVDNGLTLLEHAYMSTHSRNNPTVGIYNCVDVFINGENQQTSSSVEVVPDTANNLQSTNSLLWTYQHPAATTVINFKRKLDAVNSAVGNRVQPLFWQPVVDLPDSITVGSSTYYKANFWNSGDSTYYNQFDGTTYSFKAHYIMVEEVNALYGTLRCRNGIEWFLAGNNYLNGQLDSDTGSSYTGVKIDTQVGTQFTCSDYIYDQNVSDLQAIMEKNKQTTQDVLTHRARRRYFQPIVTIMYSLGATQSIVNVAIAASLAAFFENQYYGAAIQLSDILQVVHNTAGVDNVRWTNAGGNAVQEVAQNGNALGTPTFFTADFFIQDNELAASPDNNAVTITARAQNTF